MTLAAGNVPPALTIQMNVVDRTSGHTVFSTAVPLGFTDFGQAPAGAYRFVFVAPAGYFVAPSQIDADAVCGQPIALNARVDVIDTTPPTIDPHANITVTPKNHHGAVVTYTAPAWHDAVSGNGVAVCSPASGSLFPVGTTTVVCTAVDGAGNRSSSSFTVTVTKPGKGLGRGKGGDGDDEDDD